MVSAPWSRRSAQPPSAESLSVFFRSLSTMVAASVTLYGAVTLLARQSEDPRMARVAEELTRRLHAGAPLSRAMMASPGVFTSLQVRLIQIGERTGSLEIILAHLAEYEEKRRRIGMKVRAALVYPAFMVVLATVLLVLIPPFLFGGVFEMIRTSGVEPPLLTRLVMGFADAVRWPGTLPLAAVAGVALATWVARRMRTPAWRARLDRVVLRVPGLGTAWRNVAITRFCRALALQLRAGEFLATALGCAGLASTSTVLEERAPRAVEVLKGGAGLVEALKAMDFFPRAFVDIVRAAEESGQLDRTVAWIAEVYERELDCSLDTFTALLEPVVMLGMGLVVGVVVTATMMPMIQVLRTL